MGGVIEPGGHRSFATFNGLAGRRIAPRTKAAAPTPARLARTIEAEVIPRLLLAHRAFPECSSAADEEHVPGPEDVADFATLVLHHDVALASSYIDAMRARGASLDMIFLYLLAPTARLFGDLWKEDLCSFGEVTIGLSRLQQLLRELSSPFENEIEHAGHGYRALLAATPGEQHTFGICMVEEFFRRAGWDVSTGPGATRHDLVAMVNGEWFDVVGLSLGGEALFDALASIISAIRRASRNRSIGIMVGGRFFIEHPELIARIGADGTALDGREAVLQSRRLICPPARLA